MTESIQIEKGVPLPSGANGGKYPLQQMEVGDSFQMTGMDERDERRLRAIVGRNKNGRRFTCRKVGAETFRVWRIK